MANIENNFKKTEVDDLSFYDLVNTSKTFKNVNDSISKLEDGDIKTRAIQIISIFNDYINKNTFEFKKELNAKLLQNKVAFSFSELDKASAMLEVIGDTKRIGFSLEENAPNYFFIIEKNPYDKGTFEMSKKALKKENLVAVVNEVANYVFD